MRRHRYAPAIGVAESTMRSGLADERKPIAFESGDELSSSERPKATIVHGDVYTVTAIRGLSGETSSISTASLGPSGSGFPSSTNSWTIMRTTSLIFLSASSLLRPEVAPPTLSSAGQ